MPWMRVSAEEMTRSKSCDDDERGATIAALNTVLNTGVLVCASHLSSAVQLCSLWGPLLVCGSWRCGATAPLSCSLSLARLHFKGRERSAVHPALPSLVKHRRTVKQHFKEARHCLL
ncbi:hypothetical protein SKAU_G00270980 [Synaphobranchus kaupii]|uniref:Uncharacterized protein n=1 Tax=Synaphobranchus kaupii TaxID=118154 RepID=A0A9Q1IQK3_SYNKA|nr:hypothetical protein SKAU_G00270980 [Synaphobranchus kaupii]